MRLLPLVVAILLGCSEEQEKDPQSQSSSTAPEVVTLPPTVSIPLTQVTWGRLKFPLPTEWRDNPRHAANGRQIVFDGPREKGEPTVSLYWVESPRTLDSWASYCRNKYDHEGDAANVLERGWSKAGGKRAYYMVYELGRGEPVAGFTGTHVTIDWYFRDDGHVGFLRCTCLKEYFANGYRRLFESIAESLRFLPAPK